MIFILPYFVRGQISLMVQIVNMILAGLSGYAIASRAPLCTCPVYWPLNGTLFLLANLPPLKSKQLAPITVTSSITDPTPETKQITPITDNTHVNISVAADQAVNDLLEVHFIDVGQGDSIFLRAADGSTALIDGGNPNGLALAYLRSVGVTRLNTVILTHPHADHVGGLVDVLKTLQVDNVWTSGASNTTSIYERFLDTIAARKIPYHEAATGDKISVGSLTFDVLLV